MSQRLRSDDARVRRSGSRRWRASAKALLIAAAACTLTACGLVPTPFACPAIGWSNSLTVELEGDTAAIARLQVCIDDGCAPGDDVDPSGPLGEVDVADRDGGSWVFSVGMTSPEHVVLRMLAADGTVLSETEVAPDWVRVGGDDRCGGPGAATVRVEL